MCKAQDSTFSTVSKTQPLLHCQLAVQRVSKALAMRRGERAFWVCRVFFVEYVCVFLDYSKSKRGGHARNREKATVGRHCADRGEDI